MSEVQTKEVLSNELVRYSRAGDAFHYRFAAKFCLDMINPKSEITEITIEGSKNPGNPSSSGEYVIDLGVYKDHINEIEFYQLKHTTVQHEKVMNMSDIKDTVIGFSKRYVSLKKEKSDKAIKFIIATNRTVNPSFATSIKNIANGDLSNTRYVNKLLEYTKLSKKRLKDFCKIFLIYDSLGDYKEQYEKLNTGTLNLVAGSNGTDVVNGLIALIESRVLPDNDSPITKEDVLKRFGCNFISELFPAPPEFEINEDIIWRSEFVRITDEIEKAENPVVVTATGGVGKSIFTNNLDKHISDDYLIIRYDCFGNGKYRNRRNFRHRYRDFVLQIVNELSEKGFCNPLIHTNADDTKLLVMLQTRLQDAVDRYRNINKVGKILILVDAADNACMAAVNNNDITFANEILRESFSEYVNFIFLCRPEREEMLDIPHSVDVIEMNTFIVEDTQNFIALFFDDIPIADVEEFHRLTSGNPRIQSLVISKSDNFHEILVSLGPSQTTVEEQIKLQVDIAVNRLLDELSGDFKEKVLMMCYGLSLLPPDIPVNDLSNVIEIDEKYIISFVSELCGQIWIADGLMHFRDEPTEDWFIKNFKPNNKVVEVMISNIEKHAESSYYLAYSLPELYLLIGRYDELIDIVSERKYLPLDSELDIWDIELNRFKYAIKAAINRNNYEDIVRLGIIIGQKASEQTRLKEFYKTNIDILNIFYGDEFLSDLAFKKVISSEWNGSNVLYSALMLSFAKQYMIEARSYLRSSVKWLRIFFEERDKRDKRDFHFTESLSDNDILIFALTHRNLFGIKACADYIQLWKPNNTIVSVAGHMTRYLIDICDFDAINEFTSFFKDNIHGLIGINGELVKIGKHINIENCQKVIDSLSIDVFDYPKIDYIHEKDEYGYLVSFCELLAIDDYKSLCLSILNKYIPDTITSSVFSDYSGNERENYIRAFVIRRHFDKKLNFEDNVYFSSDNIKYSERQERENHKGIFEKLLPWYEMLFTAKTSTTKCIIEEINECYKKTRLAYHDQYGRFNSIEYDQFKIACQIFISQKWDEETEATEVYYSLIGAHKYTRIKDKIEMLRALSRNSKCFELIRTIENNIAESINLMTEEPYDRVEMYTQLSRAILSISKSDAREYFKLVVDEITKYGEELPIKWRVIEGLSRMYSEIEPNDSELSFRLIRVAEFVGEHIVRQKYWNRNEAVKIATYLSPGQGLASISRWRERDIGWHREQFANVVEALIDKKVLTPEQLWGFTGFLRTDEYIIIKVAKYCITNLENDEGKYRFVTEINDFISKNGFSENHSREFSSYLKEANLNCEGIYQGRNDDIYSQSYGSVDKENVNNSKIEFFDVWEFKNVDSLEELNGFISKSSGVYSSNDLIWKKVFDVVNINQYDQFLEAIVKIEKADINYLISIMNRIPTVWRIRPGFVGAWQKVLETLGEKHYTDLFHFYYRQYIERDSSWTIDEYKALYRGIIKGLKKNNETLYSEDYYDLVVIASRMLTYENLKKHLKTMLEPFENEMKTDFADGIYRAEMDVAQDTDNIYASYLKVALGSPENEVRWQATHALIRCAKMMDINKFKLFIETLYHSGTLAFINHDFVFYELDYEIHLLIAVHRILNDTPKKVKEIVLILEDLLSKRATHDVITYKIYEIYNGLIKMLPDALSEERVHSLEKHFSSDNVIEVNNIYGIERNDKYIEYLECKYDIYLPFAFEDWLKRFERIFNIPEKHLRNMLKEIIYSNFDIKAEEDNDKILNDNRKNVFKVHRLENRTFVSHGEHPSVENLNFYYSYHGLVMLAHKLYCENPIYTEEYEVRNSYVEWLQEQLVTRKDGYLLYDSKSVVPLNRVNYVQLPNDDKWFNNIDTDYLESLFYDDNEICFGGLWNTRYQRYNEEINIDSALVEEEYVESLLMTLKDMAPNDYYVGETEYHDAQIPFMFESWFGWESESRGIEKFDLWSPEMAYPGFNIKEHYLSQLDLSVNKEGNVWINKNNGEVKIKKYVWVEEYERNNESEFHCNERLLGTREIIDKLCEKSGKVLLLNIKVTRRQIGDRYSGYDSGDFHRYHHFKVIRRKGGEADE